MIANTSADSYSAKFFHRNDFFPIEVNFGDKEIIRMMMRPKKGTSEILDIYANTTHIGMFVGIEKSGDMIKIGPGGISKSHSYRNIPAFVFVKLLEYYGLDKIKALVVDVPENLEFNHFLTRLGFVEKNRKLILELDAQKAENFFKKLEAAKVEILSQAGQIEEVVKANIGAENVKKVQQATEKIIDKIKNMDPLGKKFWDNRKVAQINVMLSTAVILDKNLVKKEFLEVAIKTIVSSFDTYVRGAYLEELFQALEGIRIFSMPYVQKMVDKMRSVLANEIKAMNKDEFRHWIHENMTTWKLADKTAEETVANKIKESKLKPEDFGSPIKEELKAMVNALVWHYNGENVLYGLSNKL
jgi:hypothetical protein